MPAVPLIAIGTLNEYAGITQALGEHFTADVIKPNALADVSPSLFDHFIAIDIGQ